ncbi:protein FAR1-RELATED SEQUENCE 5-like [Beta vulgaris subsp. vulgaris]|uniref:protein FAR1-RELATED SEQUENCE 5-like n=1 Tax=Beta vulgaris subsp. vulgaris TaxID=3555 RepID=UPI002036F049|nr:protein FAR1-RELATED SEQUENCE 5-like [Beta vulgaris subsp. vulgaris]
MENSGLIDQIDLNQSIEPYNIDNLYHSTTTNNIEALDDEHHQNSIQNEHQDSLIIDLNNTPSVEGNVVLFHDEIDNQFGEQYPTSFVSSDESNSAVIPGSIRQSLNKHEIGGVLLGQVRSTLDDIHELYCQHAAIVGFSVRKSKNRKKEGTSVVHQKYYVCSAQGKRNTKIKEKQGENNIDIIIQDSKSKKQRTRRAMITRNKCPALIRARMNTEGHYEIVQHVIKHNHPLTSEPLNYLHRFERQMSDPKKQTIQAMQECGLRPIDSFRYMSIEVGGEDVLGHSMKDHFNCCYKLKIKPIEGKDSQKVVDNLYEQMQTDSNFFFRVRLNDEGKVCCLFWRDSMMLEDYTIFGDVMVFYTTYRTNKYNLICAPFVGINNHWKNTMFACAFLGDETMPSFEWLFETFKKSMKGKCPITIFSDQDAAIAGAIKKAFPTSRHRLCLWHLSQNANQQFGLMKADKEFKNIFHKCLSGCITTTEFEQTWSTMTTKYKLEDDRWFNRLYSLKEKWCTTFSKDFFSAGILSSQRSESANHAIGFKSTHIYTLFKDFEDEFKHAMASAIEIVGTQGNTLTYRVFLNSIDGSSQQVSFNYPEMTIECGCINFQESEPSRALIKESFKKTNSLVEELIKIEEAKVSAEKSKAHEKALQEAAAALQANESQENNAQESPPIPTVLDPVEQSQKEETTSE